MARPNQIEQSQAKLDKKRVQVGAYIQEIIKDQEKVISVSSKRIVKINSDLRALRFRLKPYTGKKPEPYDDNYFKLKDEYSELLQRRAVYQRSIIVSEESIASARLNLVPGQEYQKGEQL